MKSFQVFATLCAILSVVAAADVSSSAVALTNPARKLEGDKIWDVGTKVYKEFPNEGWWSGTISSYAESTGMYTITWEDGSTDYYDDSAEVDQMVAWASSDPQNNPAAHPSHHWALAGFPTPGCRAEKLEGAERWQNRM